MPRSISGYSTGLLEGRVWFHLVSGTNIPSNVKTNEMGFTQQILISFTMSKDCLSQCLAPLRLSQDSDIFFLRACGGPSKFGFATSLLEERTENWTLASNVDFFVSCILEGIRHALPEFKCMSL